jgi:hypothetical protein
VNDGKFHAAVKGQRVMTVFRRQSERKQIAATAIRSREYRTV